MSISGIGPTADRNGPLSVVGYGHNVFSYHSEFLENLFIIEFRYQTDGSCIWKFRSFSALASIKNVQDWAAIFIWRLGCLNVEEEKNKSG